MNEGEKMNTHFKKSGLGGGCVVFFSVLLWWDSGLVSRGCWGYIHSHHVDL
ncbi:hypothetical protein Hanom_Chr04g00323511 [Helianthus anomalus]